MSPIKSLVRKRQMEIKRKKKIKLRKHLNACEAKIGGGTVGLSWGERHERLIQPRRILTVTCQNFRLPDSEVAL